MSFIFYHQYVCFHHVMCFHPVLETDFHMNRLLYILFIFIIFGVPNISASLCVIHVVIGIKMSLLTYRGCMLIWRGLFFLPVFRPTLRKCRKLLWQHWFPQLHSCAALCKSICCRCAKWSHKPSTTPNPSTERAGVGGGGGLLVWFSLLGPPY